MATISLLDLPELVLDRIFSYLYLTNKEAIQLNLVSKEFSSLLQRRPALISMGWYDHETYKTELEYVYSTLIRYQEENICLETFIFNVEAYDYVNYELQNVHDVDRCIHLALNEGLKNLSIGFNNGPICNHHLLPNTIFGIQSLVQLHLDHCCFRNIKKLERRILWPNLRKLSLRFVRFTDEAAFQNLIKGCPLVKTLSLFWCGNPCRSRFHLKISDLPNLKDLKANLWLTHTIEVCESAATNLEDMRIETYHRDLESISLGEHEYPNLKSLRMTFAGALEGNLSIKFPRLEFLRIITTHAMPTINLSSPSLKKIYVDAFKNPLEEACFDVPNIVCFRYNHCNHQVLPKLSFKGRSVPQERWMSRIDLKCTDDVGCSWLLNQRRFFAQLNMLLDASIDVTFSEEMFLRKDHWMKTRSLSFIPVGIVTGIRRFTVTQKNWRKFSISFVRAILNAIFWIYRPRIITFSHNYTWSLNRVSRSYFYDVIRAENSRSSACDDIIKKLLKAHEKSTGFRAVFNMSYL